MTNTNNNTNGDTSTVDVSEGVETLRKLVDLRPGGQHRPQQEHMVTAVENSLNNKENLIIQAGTGTGKSWGYLIPAILSGKRVIISTATKQLSEQIADRDLPAIRTAFAKIGANRFNFTLLKGRNNYVCLAKRKELENLTEQEETQNIAFEIFGDEPDTKKTGTKKLGTARNNRRNKKTATKDTFDPELYQQLIEWADTTKTGDRSHAPAVNDKMWDQISTDSAGCPGAAACPLSSECFSEKARRRAAVTEVVITNHAQVAQDLKSGGSIFGNYETLIVDEMHELVSYLSSAWGTELYISSIKQQLTKTLRKTKTINSPETKTKLDTDLNKALELFDELNTSLNNEPEGLQEPLNPHIIQQLVTIGKTLSYVVTTLMYVAENQAASPIDAVEYKSHAGNIAETVEKIVITAAPGKENVLWLEKTPAGPTKTINTLKTAPLWVGEKLIEFLGEKTLIGTSATITVGGTFDSTIRELALKNSPHPYQTVDVGTPFDYRKQGMIYVPTLDFPEPVGKDRIEHGKAVNKELLDLVKAAGGRTLALFSTRDGAEKAAEYLGSRLTTPVLCQGDAPPQQLVDEFAKNPTTTLCATRGFWHGVDVPGDSLSLVVMDKIPFSPMNDPLMSARKEDANNNGRNGFMEIFVSDASTRLAQGAGRLIRAETDKGVIAILDTRILTKTYGKVLQKALPEMGLYRDKKTVIEALKRLTGTK